MKRLHFWLNSRTAQAVSHREQHDRHHQTSGHDDQGELLEIQVKDHQQRQEDEAAKLQGETDRLSHVSNSSMWFFGALMHRADAMASGFELPQVGWETGSRRGGD